MTVCIKHCGAVLLLCARAHANRVLPISAASSSNEISSTVLSSDTSESRNRLCIQVQPAASDTTLGVSNGSDLQPFAPSLEPADGAVSTLHDLSELKSALSIDSSSGECTPTLFLHGGGVVASIMSAKETHSAAISLISQAKESCIVSAFTFDYGPLLQSMCETARRGVRVELLVDSTQVVRGSTKMQAERCASLQSSGGKVLLVDGAGVQHSKTLCIDAKYCIVGSCNWTNSSRSNHELSVLFVLNSEGRLSLDRKFEKLRASARPFTKQDEAEGETVRQRRARSVNTADRYRTAKSFSIARARAASRDCVANRAEP